MSEKKSNHQVKVVRITEINPHTNADTLELIIIGGYQVVSKKGQFKIGDLGIYIQPDSVVPQTEPFRFIWNDYAEAVSLGCALPPAGWLCTREPGHEGPCAAVEVAPERRRRITVRKFRKEWSEGLLLPLSDFYTEFRRHGQRNRDAVYQTEDGLTHMPINEGDDVSDILGITHYDPDKGRESTRGDNESEPKFNRWPRSLKGWWYFALYKLFGYNPSGAGVNGWDKEQTTLGLPVYDVEAFKNYARSFEAGEEVVVTEKIHGSNARFIYKDGKMYAGSRQFWKSPKSKCVWRKALEHNPWIELWCKGHAGYALYGEVVPTQAGYNYGARPGEVLFFVFDVRTPDGEWVAWHNTVQDLSDVPGLEGETHNYHRPYQFEPHGHVPVLYEGPFDLEKIKTLVDGPSTVANANHIREGVVVKPATERHVIGLGRLILKIVSNAYLAKEVK